MSFAPEEIQNYPINLAPLPKGWEVATIAEIATAVEPGFPSGKHNKEGRGVPHLRPMNISRDGVVDLSEVKYVESGPSARLIDGDVLFNNTNSPILIGKTAVICKPNNWAFSNHMTRIHPASGISSVYLAHQLHYLWMSGYFRHRCAHHVNQASISSGPLANTVPVVIPPTAEQVRIVAAIEEQFSRLDAAVAALGYVKVGLKRFRVALMQAAVLGRLAITVQDIESPPHGPLARPAPMKRRAGRLWGSGSVPQLTEEERTSVPAHWKWSKVSELGFDPEGTVQVGPMSMRSADFAESGIPVLTVGSVQWDQIDESKLSYLAPAIAESFSRYRIQPGDVLFTRAGTVGRAAVAEERHQDWLMTFNLLRVRVDPNICLPQYLRMVFEAAPHVRRQARGAAIGSTRVAFNTHLLAELDVPLPPVHEQISIVQTVQLYLSRMGGLDPSLWMHESQALRSSILAAAFSGRLAPQDPDEEPASVLLKRIAAGRASANRDKAGRTRRIRGLREQVIA